MPPATAPVTEPELTTEFLLALGFEEEEIIEVCTLPSQAKNADAMPLLTKKPINTLTKVGEAFKESDKSLMLGDVYFSAAVLKGPRCNANATRLPNMGLDLDFKDTGLKSRENADKLIALLVPAFGTPTTVMSGAGYQTHWPMADDGMRLYEVKAARYALLTYAREVAAEHGLGTIDSTYEAARLYRLPGTFNFKYDALRPTPTELVSYGDGRKLDPKEVWDFCVENCKNPIELPSGGVVGGSKEIVSHPDTWKWAKEKSCQYPKRNIVQGMIENAEKYGSRHNAFMSSCYRLVAHRRWGCFTEEDYEAEKADLIETFHEMLAEEPNAREPQENEALKMLSFAELLYAGMTNEQVIKRGDLRKHIDIHENIQLSKLARRRKIGEQAGIKTFSSITKYSKAKYLYRQLVKKIGINMFRGDPGSGKTTLAIEIVAKASRGELDGFDGDILVLNLEDQIEEKWKPNLFFRGANQDKIWYWTPDISAEYAGENNIFYLNDRYEELAEYITEKNIQLIIVETFAESLGSDVDMDRNKDTSTAQVELNNLLYRYGITLIGLHHNKKNTSGTKGSNRHLGATALGGRPRTIIAFKKEEDKDSPHGFRFLVGHAKNNSMAEFNTEVFTLKNIPSGVLDDDGESIDTWLLEWVGNDTRSMDEIETEEPKKVTSKPGDVDRPSQKLILMDFIIQEFEDAAKEQEIDLASKPVSIPQKTLYESAHSDGLFREEASEDTNSNALTRARTAINSRGDWNIKPHKVALETGPAWVWVAHRKIAGTF